MRLHSPFYMYCFHWKILLLPFICHICIQTPGLILFTLIMILPHTCLISSHLETYLIYSGSSSLELPIEGCYSRRQMLLSQHYNLAHWSCLNLPFSLLYGKCQEQFSVINSSVKYYKLIEISKLWCAKLNPTEFCTAWPAGLETTTKQEKHFPVTVSKSSYLHSSPTVRDPKARIVTLKVGF